MNIEVIQIKIKINKGCKICIHLTVKYCFSRYNFLNYLSIAKRRYVLSLIPRLRDTAHPKSSTFAKHLPILKILYL